jgi:hypothetical protein
MASLLLRYLFIIYLVTAFVIAIAYLRYRRCTPVELVLWGGLAFCLPVIGPFFVIAARPGPKKRLRSPRQGKR